MAALDAVHSLSARLLVERVARPVARLLEFFAGSLRRALDALLSRGQPDIFLKAIPSRVLVIEGVRRQVASCSRISIAEFAPAISPRGPPC